MVHEITMAGGKGHSNKAVVYFRLYEQSRQNKKRSIKMGKKCRESAENRLKFHIFKCHLLVSIA